jgi:RNA polymerase sigma factor (sigma-70 family)
VARDFARELPRDFNPNPDDESYWEDVDDTYIVVGGDSRRPSTPMQALMECQPHREPEVSRIERLELRDVIVDALDDLDMQEQWIFDALFVRRLSLRELAAEIAMPKTTVARWRDRLLSRLRDKLETDPRITEYLVEGH